MEVELVKLGIGKAVPAIITIEKEQFLFPHREYIRLLSVGTLLTFVLVDLDANVTTRIRDGRLVADAGLLGPT